MYIVISKMKYNSRGEQFGLFSQNTFDTIIPNKPCNLHVTTAVKKKINRP